MSIDCTSVAEDAYMTLSGSYTSRLHWKLWEFLTLAYHQNFKRYISWKNISKLRPNTISVKSFVQTKIGTRHYG